MSALRLGSIVLEGVKVFVLMEFGTYIFGWKMMRFSRRLLIWRKRLFVHGNH